MVAWSRLWCWSDLRVCTILIKPQDWPDRFDREPKVKAGQTSYQITHVINPMKAGVTRVNRWGLCLNLWPIDPDRFFSFVVMLLEHMLLLLLLLGNMCWYYQLYLMWICFALNLTKKKHKWLHQGLNLHPQNPFSHKFTTKLIIG